MNVTSTAALIEGASVIDQLWKFLLATRAELFVFCAAVAANLLLFGNRTPKNSRSRNQKAKRIEVEDDLDDDHAHGKPSPKLNTGDAKQLAESFHAAFDAGDHRQALQCWNLLKRFDAVPAVPIAQAVESMQRFKKDPALVMRELKAFFSKHPTECSINVVNDLLESLTKRLDSDLVDKIVTMMSSMKVQPDQRTYEVRLTMHFTTRAFSEVQKLLAEMEKEGIPCTTKASIVAVKAALKTGNFKEAMKRFQDLKSLWSGHSSEGATASMAPRHIISQLVDLACRDHQLAQVLPHLAGVPISEDAVSSMLSECIRQRDPELTKQVETLVRDQGHQLSDATYTLLVKSVSSDPARVQALFDEVVAKGTTVSADFALALLAFCAQTRSMKLADRLFEHMKPKQVPVLSAFIRFYTDTEQYDKACNIYEEHLKSKPVASATAAPEESSPQGQGSFLDVRTERSLMGAALRCGRQDLAKRFLDAAPMDVAKHITMIRDCASSRNLKGAMQVFETLRKSGAEVNGVVYNTVLDACVECNDLKAAQAWMAQTKSAGLADVVSYNTLIKAYLQNKDFSKARSLMEEMRQEGLQPNRVTFNELVNGLVTKGTQSQRAEIWGIVKEMKAAGVKPNQVTCSILLKSLNAYSRECDILETMDLISSMEEPMDEVLLSSVVEACVRIGKPELLSNKLKQLQSTESLSVTGSHTFGSLIKAYGHAKDIDGVWRCWKEMRSRHIRPTSITLGCMVEAVVSNGDTEGAYELIHQMQDDDRCRDVLNAVIYCSVLKGFTREKKMQRVWAVYEEMQSRKVEVSIVMYNTLLDACARCGRMDRVPTIVEDMRKHEIRANLITYSTMVKGHCQAGDIEQGFNILEQMKTEAGLKPDEIMYNSLLDGCAQNNLVDEGLKLLDRMQKEGVQPSNFTLSLLVKLMNRCRKLDSAFDLVDEISKKYGFSPNVHVYTNLIQACIANRQLQRGMTTFQRMLKERVQPESRTYCILMRASVTQNQLDQAAGLLRAALGLSGAQPYVTEAQARLASIHNLDYALISEALQGLAEKGRGQDLAAPLLSDIKRCKPGVRVDSNVQRRVMSAGFGSDAAGHTDSGANHFERRRGGGGGGGTPARGGRGREGGRSERSW